jgi:hypothetical protein
MPQHERAHRRATRAAERLDFERHVLTQIQRLARPILLTQMRRDGCIAATRVLITALQYFEIPAEPVPVEALLMNREWVKLATDLGRTPTAAEWTQHDGVWSVGVGCAYDPALDPDPQPDRWHGHLVAVAALVDGERYLIDASLDQGSRPQYGIIAPPCVITRASPAFLAGNVALASIPDPRGAVITYRVRPDADPTWRAAPDWTEPGRYVELALTLKLAVEKEVIVWAQERAAR